MQNILTFFVVWVIQQSSCVTLGVHMSGHPVITTSAVINCGKRGGVSHAGCRAEQGVREDKVPTVRSSLELSNRLLLSRPMTYLVVWCQFLADARHKKLIFLIKLRYSMTFFRANKKINTVRSISEMRKHSYRHTNQGIWLRSLLANQCKALRDWQRGRSTGSRLSFDLVTIIIIRHWNSFHQFSFLTSATDLPLSRKKLTRKK